jgi:1,4-dihydroxy-2-naphthoate octaprenyltransferase
MNLKTWAMASRAPFFVAVIMPSLMGGAVAFYHGSFDIFLFLVVVLGMVLANAGTNFINDYFDFKSGADVRNKNRTPFSGGSPFLPNATLKPENVLYVALSCFAIAFSIAIYLAMKVGYIVLVIAGIGGFIGYFYTAPPFKLGYWGIGEFATGLALGPLTVIGVYYVMTSTITVESIIVSIPIGVLVATILYVNEIPDYEADKSAGKRHLVVILGKAKAVKLLPILFLLVYSSIIFGVVFKIMPVWTLIALVTFPVAINIIKIANGNYNSTARYIPAQAKTIAVHSITGILIIAGYLIPAFLK